MMSIIGNVIVGILTLAGVIITVIVGNNKNQALLDYKMSSLEEKVKVHNGLIDRMYKVENRVTLLEDHVKG